MRTTREEMKRRHDSGKENQLDTMRAQLNTQRKLREKPARNKGIEPSAEFKKKFGLSKA